MYIIIYGNIKRWQSKNHRYSNNSRDLTVCVFYKNQVLATRITYVFIPNYASWDMSINKLRYVYKIYWKWYYFSENKRNSDININSSIANPTLFAFSFYREWKERNLVRLCRKYCLRGCVFYCTLLTA